MNQRGQVIIIIAFLIIAGLFLLALLVDGGRLYLRRAEAQRAVQAAADAGISVVAEQMVTQVIPRQTQAAGRPGCLPDGEFGDESAVCTTTPKPEHISHWLTDEDRQSLVEPSMQATVEALAVEYATYNGYQIQDPAVIELRVDYPFHYQPDNTYLQLRVFIRQRVTILLAGLLGQEFVEIPISGVSKVPQR